MQPSLTIFTPAYNRAHTLPRLFDSLKNQTDKNFEWLVIDDGSTDSTQELFAKWLKSDHGFKINYIWVTNGGKNRAINRGLAMAKGRYFMILDSDDLLTSDAVHFICERIKEIETDNSFIGISGRRGDLEGRPLGVSKDLNENGYIDCTNLERNKYGLQRDMAEVFVTDRLRKYEFKVWSGEKFTPEEVVWNQIAMDGYKIRWFNKITYICEYQHGGLSDSTWRLLRDNPMGYAMMWNQRILFYSNVIDKLNAVTQYCTCCILAKEWKEISKCESKLSSFFLLPISIFLAIRRKYQINRLTRVTQH